MRPASFEAKRFFLQADPTTLQPTPEIGQMIRQVWQDEGVRRAVPHADLHDSATYFMDRCLEITAKDYLPTRQDVIMFRRPSTGCRSNHDRLCTSVVADTCRRYYREGIHVEELGQVQSDRRGRAA